MRPHFLKFLGVIGFAVLTTTVILIFRDISRTDIESLYLRKHLDDSKVIMEFKSVSLQKLIQKIRIKTFPKQDQHIFGNIPEMYFENNTKFPSQYNTTCARFPKLFDLKFTNDQWQTLKMTNLTLQLFNAYYDHRNVKEGKRAIRIISMYDEFNSKARFYCQFWYEKSEKPVIVESEQLKWIWNKRWGGNIKGVFHPYIITCLLSSDLVIPRSVSVVENPCDNANNNLRIFFKEVKKEEKKNFLVCVKGLNFPFEDRSIRLVEWIELLFILGADKINFYKYHVHPNVQKVLDYYSNSTRVEVTPISLVDGASNSPYFQSKYLREHFYEQVLPEVIAYNDCLYKHLNEFEFVVLLDTDEVIVPTNGSTWIDLIRNIKEDERTSYIARNVYFLDSYQHNHSWFEEAPKFLHMLQHVYRAQNYSNLGSYVKGFHVVDRMTALHNHFPIDCFGGCYHMDINIHDGHLQHYRIDCSEKNECVFMRNHSIIDARLWNYKEVLIQRTLQALNNLEMIEVDNN